MLVITFSAGPGRGSPQPRANANERAAAVRAALLVSAGQYGRRDAPLTDSSLGECLTALLRRKAIPLIRTSWIQIASIRFLLSLTSMISFTPTFFRLVLQPPPSLLSSRNVYLKINKTHMLQTSESSTHNLSHKANTYGISLLNCWTFSCCNTDINLPTYVTLVSIFWRLA